MAYAKRREQNACVKTVLDTKRQLQKEKQDKRHAAYWTVDTSFWRFHGRCPKGHMLSFITMLRKPMPKEEIEKRLAEAFGDL